MAISKNLFSLVKKRQLTNDVFELHFSIENATQVKAGEYIIFDLPAQDGTIVKRAYSIAYADGKNFSFVVKRVAEGKGSPILCDAPVGTEFMGMGPMGHFTLRETPVSKCFIGTGTGFAPLYFQLRKSAELFPEIKTRFVFGVREAKDLFYAEEIIGLQKALPNLEVEYYLSREKVDGAHQGYVTEFFTEENVAQYEEYYMCGSPSMIKDARARLEGLGIAKEKVFFEQF